MDMFLGHQIKKLRLERGITQEALAEYVGISYQAVSKWETGTTLPDITLLPKLAAFFGVRIDDLFSVNYDDELERIDHILAHEKLTDKCFLYAKRTLDSILCANENNVPAIKRYVELYLKRNKRDIIEADMMLRKAMTTSPTDSELFSLYRRVCGCDVYSFRCGNDKFISVCLPYAENDKSDHKLYEALIEAMLEMRYFDKAEKLICAMQCDKENKGMRDILYGDLMYAQGNSDEAKKYWLSVPENDHKGQYEAGERWNRVGEYEKATECYQNSFRCAPYPRDLSAVYSLAFLYTKLGKREMAIEMWEQIITVLSNDHGISESETIDWANREIEKLKSY